MKPKFRIEDMHIDIKCVGAGVWMYILTNMKESPSPIAFMWGMGFCAQDKGEIRYDILGSYTEPYSRRRGALSLLMDKAFEHYTVLTTSTGSKDGGLKSLKALGFKFDSRAQIWSKRRIDSRRR